MWLFCSCVCFTLRLFELARVVVVVVVTFGCCCRQSLVFTLFTSSNAECNDLKAFVLLLRVIERSAPDDDLDVVVRIFRRIRVAGSHDGRLDRRRKALEGDGFSAVNILA